MLLMSKRVQFQRWLPLEQDKREGLCGMSSVFVSVQTSHSDIAQVSTWYDSIIVFHYVGDGTHFVRI